MRVLVLADVDPTIPFDYGGERCWNAGNNVFATAMAQYFSVRGGVFRTIDDVRSCIEADSDWAQIRFDCAVVCEACFLSDEYVDYMERRVTLFKQLGIPVFALGAGVQAHLGVDASFVETIREPASRYLDAIYSSGGRLTVRGEFSRMICRELGYECEVTGCTSVFLHGADFKMTNTKVSRAEFHPVLNGREPEDIPPHIYHDNPDISYFDQDLFQKLLYEPEQVDKVEMSHLVSAPLVRLYEQSLKGNVRLHLYEDFPAWVSELRRLSASFSYGSRMHGNVIALLSGIPCFVQVKDLRVQELVDFYQIPNSSAIPFDPGKDSLFDLYSSLDWTAFNENYARRQAAFARVLDSIAPVCSAHETTYPPFRFASLRQPSFTPKVLSRLHRALMGRRLHRSHFFLADLLTCGFLHRRLGEKYVKYWL